MVTVVIMHLALQENVKQSQKRIIKIYNIVSIVFDILVGIFLPSYQVQKYVSSFTHFSIPRFRRTTRTQNHSIWPFLPTSHSRVSLPNQTPVSFLPPPSSIAVSAPLTSNPSSASSLSLSLATLLLSTFLGRILSGNLSASNFDVALPVSFVAVISCLL